jgi:hypothetical protein
MYVFLWALGTLVVLAVTVTGYWMLYERFADKVRLWWLRRRLTHYMALSDQQVERLVETESYQSRIPLGPPASARKHAVTQEVREWCLLNEIEPRVIPSKTWKVQPRHLAFRSDAEAMAFMMRWG